MDTEAILFTLTQRVKLTNIFCQTRSNEKKVAYNTLIIINSLLSEIQTKMKELKMS